MRVASLCLTLLACAGCAGSLTSPASTRHPLSSFLEVPYPPPAALAETVPSRPDVADAVWVDGEWLFNGKSYTWRRGGWVIAPPRGRFARWESWYRRDGRLMLAPGTWYGEQHEPLRAPRPLAPAMTPTNELTAESQTGR